MESSINTQLATDCVHHLESEQDALANLLENLRSIRQSLLSNDAAGTETLIEQQSIVLREMGTIATARGKLRRRISHAFEVAEQTATIGLVLANTTGDSRHALLDQQSRIRDEVQKLHGVLTVLGSLSARRLELLEKVFHSLSGEAGLPRVYGANGLLKVA